MNSSQKWQITVDIPPPDGGYLPDTQTVLLLADIQRTGSINRSAKEKRLSYATAWRCLKEAEAGLGMRLLVPQKGGAGGGGTALTPQGRDFVRKYIEMLTEVKRLASECFARYFPAE
ncbi:LysR family transcriptional regulator [Oscillospiraceae bacterium OttesenSCG-928-G22]|nr:LysR family transcriptional regulator [Oscillospiraceae bacterium OttesenSCG-928-G22]